MGASISNSLPNNFQCSLYVKLLDDLFHILTVAQLGLLREYNNYICLQQICNKYIDINTYICMYVYCIKVFIIALAGGAQTDLAKRLRFLVVGDVDGAILRALFLQRLKL